MKLYEFTDRLLQKAIYYRHNLTAMGYLKYPQMYGFETMLFNLHIWAVTRDNERELI